MAQLVYAATHADPRGKLTVIDNIVPFDVKRAFFIYDVTSDRGNHGHKRNRSALVCVKGTCKVKVLCGSTSNIYDLDVPEKVLILEPEEYRTMYDFSPDAVLLVLASEHFDSDDYVEEPPV